MNSEQTQRVESWWNENPFTYNGSLGVGHVPEVTELTIKDFDAFEEKYKRHSGNSTQEENEPVFSKFITYEDLKGKRVLDIATGTGFATVTFASFGAEVTGIDITEYAVVATKRNFEVRGLTGDILKMDGQKLAFPDNHFDFVCAHGCLMHMPDTNQAVREIFRVLKPEGKLYAWMYHRGWHYWFNIMFVRGLLLGGFFKYGFSSLAMTSRFSDGAHLGGNPHTKFYSRGGFRRLFSQAGFSDVNIHANYNPYEWDSWPAGKFRLGWILPKRVQRFLSETCGFSFACSITATKK